MGTHASQPSSVVMRWRRVSAALASPCTTLTIDGADGDDASQAMSPSASAWADTLSSDTTSARIGMVWP